MRRWLGRERQLPPADAEYPPSWSGLTHPWIRAELLFYLKDLAAKDPRAIWQTEAKRGLVSGIDQVIHFLFDDHEFDERAIGVDLFDKAEVVSMQAVTEALDELISLLRRGGDDDYVEHPRWAKVTEAAAAALERMIDR
jgi:hypothetical protein